MKRPRSESAAAVDSSAPLALDALLASSVPLVFEGRASGSCWTRLWPALQTRGQRLRTAFRTHAAAPRSVRESECAVVSATLSEFAAWARGERGGSSELDGLASGWWAYADYKRWHELFGDDDEAAAAAAECVDWDALVAERDALEDGLAQRSMETSALTEALRQRLELIVGQDEPLQRRRQREAPEVA